jgi:hypothetical integral membrane protein (TIGR02206 family)
MPAHLHLFGLVHLSILAAVLLLAFLFTAIQRRLPPGSKMVRLALALLLFASWAAYYVSSALQGAAMFPNHLPLELCDASSLLIVAALLTLNPLAFDLGYYYALAGATMSLLTPNLPETASLFMSVQFFADHGLIVIAVIYLVWSRQARPRPWSVARAALALNVMTALVLPFDLIFKTDYMFLRSKPPTVSALDLLGPWPWYILSCEGVGICLFLLLYLPFRKAPRLERYVIPAYERRDAR